MQNQPDLVTSQIQKHRRGWIRMKTMLGWCYYLKLEMQVEEQFWNGEFFMFGIYWVWGPCMPAQLIQPCVTLCDLMDCSPPGSSVHGILQARILEWVAMPFSRIFLTQGLNSRLPASPAFQADTLPTEPPGRPEFEVPEGKSSGKVYQEVKGWDLNLKSLGLNIHLVIDIGVVIEATTLSKEK